MVKLRTLEPELHFPLDTSSLVVQVAGKRVKRIGIRKRTLTERGMLKLERIAALPSVTPYVRTRAAGFVAAALSSLRHASARQFLIRSVSSAGDVAASLADVSLDPGLRQYLSSSGGVVRGVVLLDPKTSMEDGIPAVTSVRGISGSSMWAREIYALQQRCETKCVVYDDDSPSGDPFQAQQTLDAAADLGRSKVALRSLLASDVCEPSFDLSDLGDAVPHMLKSFLPTISRNSGDRAPDTNEIGKWSGSSSQTHADPTLGPSIAAALAADQDDCARHRILDVYTHEALGDGGRVCRIMEQQISRARDRVLATAEDDLPPRGGFGYYASVVV